MDFINWLSDNELWQGHCIAFLCEQVYVEGRKNPEKLRAKNFSTKAKQNNFWDDSEKANFKRKNNLVEPPMPESCPITPLSGYRQHIKAIQTFSMASPENFAQTMMFSPLSANVPFPKHWDNFYVLMLILKHHFPNKVDKKELLATIDGFGDKYHALGHSIASFKFDTIEHIWNARHQLYSELPKLAAQGNDKAIISRLSQIPGVKPVKAGFIAQLLFGRAGCIDVHNLDIYGKVFPELKPKLDPNRWQRGEEGVDDYVDTLQSLEKKGIGTEQLWDVWVDFVENYFKMITEKGAYASLGSAIDPDDPNYKALKGIEIPKMIIGREGEKKGINVPLVSGKHGMGASATHLQDDPDNVLMQWHKMYRQGKPGSVQASAIPFRKYITPTGERPYDPMVLGTQPSALHYFEPAISGNNVDPDVIRQIIRQRQDKGGRKAAAAALAAKKKREIRSFDFGD